jgi:ribosomal protein L11 methyltransferase
LAPGVEDDGRLADALLQLGGRAVHFDDGWWTTHLAESVVDTSEPRTWSERVAAFLPPGGAEVEVGWQEHGDWAELWKRGLEPRRLTSRLVVTPSWCAPTTRPGDLVVTLDPGMAFGNAEHGTTRGCLRLLERVVAPGEEVLDVGAGSAVLSIAAALFGAGRVTAIEADPLAVPAARENVDLNGVADRVHVIHAKATAEDLASMGPCDGLVANIERGILESLLPGFAKAIRPGGWLILSGLPVDEWAGMAVAADAAGFRIEATDTDGAWRSGRFTRRGP